MILTNFAFFQSPRPDPFDARSFHGWSWIKNPIERNAFKRLPVITSDINDIFILPETNKIWIVGSGGLIAHSDDGGNSWEHYKFGLEVNIAKGRPEKAAYKYFPGLISEAYAEDSSPLKEILTERQQIQSQVQDEWSLVQQTIPQNQQSSFPDIVKQKQVTLEQPTNLRSSKSSSI